MSYFDPHRISPYRQNYKYQKKGQVIQKKALNPPIDLMHVSDYERETWFYYLQSINYKGLGSFDPATSISQTPLSSPRENESFDEYVYRLLDNYPHIRFYCSPNSVSILIMVADDNDTIAYRLQSNFRFYLDIYEYSGEYYFQVTTEQDGIRSQGASGGNNSYISSVGSTYSELSDAFKKIIFLRLISSAGLDKVPYVFD